MEQSPSWEANRFLAIQGIPHTQQNLKVYYCIHNFPAPALILNQINPVHNSPSFFLKIHFSIILPCTSLNILQEFFFYSVLPIHCRCRGLFLQLIARAVTYMLCMTPLEQGSARRSDTTHDTRKRKSPCPRNPSDRAATYLR